MFAVKMTLKESGTKGSKRPYSYGISADKKFSENKSKCFSYTLYLEVRNIARRKWTPDHYRDILYVGLPQNFCHTVGCTLLYRMRLCPMFQLQFLFSEIQKAELVLA